MQELVHVPLDLRGEKNLKPCPQNTILVPL